ncbi:hypothetical protein B0T25DRAFT_540658 [Lasiosphaeria hispida]|uniref:Secreted protein n=1 Tax=Lasiosphaeria hispida TaxID=260671 RepID=A0AAJ0HN59_9PEZI|nr:hypothetical protein B0T25DRAFT_540658 [Lasiosphaeria hispida]
MLFSILVYYMHLLLTIPTLCLADRLDARGHRIYEGIHKVDFKLQPYHLLSRALYRASHRSINQFNHHNHLFQLIDPDPGHPHTSPGFHT